METAAKTDYLKENAGNIWFVLGAYFFAFFPWMVMNNIDYISEKWRTCRRTRKLAHIHVASSILPIIYVAVYAEAQRRDGDSKELGAALSALMFNVFQLMRTIMGLVQLNAFVAWCKHAVECIDALEGYKYSRWEKRMGRGEGNIRRLMEAVREWQIAFVSWYKRSVRRMWTLLRRDSENRGDGECYPWSSSESTEAWVRDKMRTMTEILREWQNVFVSWFKRGLESMRTLPRRDNANGEQRRNDNDENSEPSVNLNVHRNDLVDAEKYINSVPEIDGENGDADPNPVSNKDVIEEVVECTVECRHGRNEPNPLSNKQSSRRKKIDIKAILKRNLIVSWCKNMSEWASRRDVDGENGIEDVIMVNNTVVDNELGGREVTVLPSWEKIWSGLKRGRFTPSEWLWTDRAILNTVRWSGAYLCGMGADWSAHVKDYAYDFRAGTEILESFFSREMGGMRCILQRVEWEMEGENGEREFLSIHRLGGDGRVDLTEAMSSAYGNRDTSYDVSDTCTVDAYSFEFDSLVSSYPGKDKNTRGSPNRESVTVGLVHSVLLAKHIGIEKLHAIRRYYDEYCVPEGIFLRNAIKLLHLQTNTHIPDDARIWEMFDYESICYQIPIFPYRMQMVALWDEGTNRRVLQASAYQDIFNSLIDPTFFKLQYNNEQRVLRDALEPVNIFDYCGKWTIAQISNDRPRWKGSLGVVMETVRTFLAEWLKVNTHEPNWEPEIPTASVEFNTRETIKDRGRLTWICQRELQRKVAKMSKEEESFSGNAALIMLFILGFPLLHVNFVEDTEVCAQDSQDEIQEASISSSSRSHYSVFLSQETWRAWTPLAPQDISLIIPTDSDSGTVSLKLQNNSGDAQFIWQDWVDAAMGCMKRFEESRNGELGYGRKIVRADLRKPMVELCPLLVNGDGEGAVVKKTSITRVWTGWTAFDMRICKFEVEQWLDACDLDIRKDWVSEGVLKSVEGVLKAIIYTENEEAEVRVEYVSTIP